VQTKGLETINTSRSTVDAPTDASGEAGSVKHGAALAYRRLFLCLTPLWDFSPEELWNVAVPV